MTNPIETSIPQHTPGPWVIESTFLGNDESLVISDKVRVDGASFGPIAVVDMSDETEATDRANAQLIAAAPEMLEALKVAEACLLYEYQHQGKPSHLISLEIIRAAIAKAEGRQS